MFDSYSISSDSIHLCLGWVWYTSSNKSDDRWNAWVKSVIMELHRRRKPQNLSDFFYCERRRKSPESLFLWETIFCFNRETMRISRNLLLSHRHSISFASFYLTVTQFLLTISCCPSELAKGCGRSIYYSSAQFIFDKRDEQISSARFFVSVIAILVCPIIMITIRLVRNGHHDNRFKWIGPLDSI